MSLIALIIDAYGTLINQTGNTPNNYLYSGEQFDPDLGFYYNRARYLNVGTGRFWSMDSYEGDNFDPISLHKYLYASDDSVNKIDPSGLDDANLPATVGTFSIASIVSSLPAIAVYAAQGAVLVVSFAAGIATEIAYETVVQPWLAGKVGTTPPTSGSPSTILSSTLANQAA